MTEYVNVLEVSIPGVIVLEDEAYGECGGRLYPVTGLLRAGDGFIPVLDIPLKDDLPYKGMVTA
ncbi:MAG: hypothetical protein IJE22_08570 [Oscillibacter sp.]|nr:hypothetical protein [Oscillibacter sp.]